MLSSPAWAVELDEFGKCYARGWLAAARPAVQKLSLRVRAGEVVGLLGPNGSGKTTTLKALAGLVRPTSGSCRIGGAAAGTDAARVQVGYLPESIRLPGYATGREWLGLCAAMSSSPAGQAPGRIAAILAWAGLAAEADQHLRTYSKGMAQRLGLAAAVVHEPRVVLLDEPASGLDPQGRLALLRLIRDLAGQGRTVIFTAHLLASLESVCDRIVILGQGRILAEGTPADLLGEISLEGNSALEALYLRSTHGFSR
jgi:ABC-type multidrug transport system ATPase subunit